MQKEKWAPESGDEHNFSEERHLKYYQSNRRVFLLEGEAEKRENRLATEVGSLLRASMRADEQIKAKNTLEAAISNNEEDIDELENHLKVKLKLLNTFKK